jgi:hypothetical protein
LKHITEAGWKPQWAWLRGMDRINNWQKTMSVQASVFFPEALLESLTSMTGGGVLADLSKDLVSAFPGKEHGDFTMVGFYHMLRSGHPFAVGFVQKMVRNGMTLSTTQNPSGVPVGYVQRDIDNIVRNMERLLGNGAATKTVKAVLTLPQKQQKLVFAHVHVGHGRAAADNAGHRIPARQGDGRRRRRRQVLHVPE